MIMTITYENAIKYSTHFFIEAKQYPEIFNRIDEQFKACLFAPSLGCQIPRDILPFCGKVLRITEFVYNKKNDNKVLYKTWKCILKYLCQDAGLKIERYNIPPTQLCFPLSRSILKGRNITFDKVSFLNPADNDVLENLIKKAMRFTEQSCGYSVFSKDSLKMMLTAENTLCAYSTTVEGKITGLVWGIKLNIKQQNNIVPIFYVLFAAREPEYSGQNIYEKMVAAFHPHLTEEGPFVSEFVCWKQGKNNIINNNAINKFKKDWEELNRSESEPYSFEGAENCCIKLDPLSTSSPPSDDDLNEACLKYAINAGDFLTFAYEFPSLMFKINFWWKAWYTQNFPIPENYQTSLQPFKK